ncbi:hypothetical protein ACIPW9_12715 [Streptomyces sp. NPDC090052]|uniref:hypothetical protein n=1 Tax=unclassified Streptomyces TaxID=2593676 RepID=UPI00225986FE|nr:MULTISPECIES: hypothetical protein [unclassified Streptomyces]MCX4726018.1 hypothetical protein [Streptomyces sp. NBC_01306]WSV04629.1 hypothetical protein OG372_14100 [Streptomyces sp. NBC_01020]WSX42727.1 hypothetical protein OG760_13980 [Streptomyces sp. NBC_00963]WSX69255.1 hypothetical protein OG221_23115 [Streptomyces sp. NBC_00932]
MRRTIATQPFDVEALLPELAGLARGTTLLYPRRGEPGVHDSSVGGPLLWPAAEPWPRCADPGHWKPLRTPTEVVGPDPVAMVPVVQLYARDVPELPFPEGRDLLQVTWCALIHDDGPATVRPKLYWRSERETVTGGVLADRPLPYECDEEFTPRPCTVSPTRVVEYPNSDLPAALAAELGGRFDQIEEELGCSYYDVATVLQTKVAGYPCWTRRPAWPRCSCGRRMEHLLSITASEPAGGRWLPLDEHRPGSREPFLRSDADPAVVDDIGHHMVMGGLGGVYLFVCTACPGMPYAHRYDC